LYVRRDSSDIPRYEMAHTFRTVSSSCWYSGSSGLGRFLYSSDAMDWPPPSSEFWSVYQERNEKVNSTNNFGQHFIEWNLDKLVHQYVGHLCHSLETSTRHPTRDVLQQRKRVDEVRPRYSAFSHIAHNGLATFNLWMMQVFDV